MSGLLFDSTLVNTNSTIERTTEGAVDEVNFFWVEVGAHSGKGDRGILMKTMVAMEGKRTGVCQYFYMEYLQGMTNFFGYFFTRMKKPWPSALKGRRRRLG